MLHFHVITLFPELIESYTGESILKRGQEAKRIRVSTYNLRQFTKDKWKRVDQRPYGGGPGMVLEAPSLLKAAEKALGKKKGKKKVIFLSPGGKQFTNADAKKLSAYDHVLFICGRYEGVDARVKKILKAEEVSIGPYVVTGGELPALMIIDATARHVKGVLGNFDSVEEHRVASNEVYTRPEVLEWKGKKHKVPKVLLTGHHGNIEEWKKKKRG